jgi:hypothetical protein
MQKNHRRGIAISIMVIAISILNFTNLDGSECIRPIHVATLLLCGMGIGVLIINLFGLLAKRTQ